MVKVPRVLGYVQQSLLVQTLMQMEIEWFLGQQLQFLSFEVSGLLV